ncbi:hypothetical protein PSENEW3_00000483 [Picochlorum sp. SENEW3]|nr:hypothetical protein PSENEW3_00000483 [Picochlorum sp. SENEW3]
MLLLRKEVIFGVGIVFAALLGCGRGDTIEWSLGKKYPNTTVEAGDWVTFEYRSGIHDVWSMRGATCDFEGATRMDASGASSYTVQLTEPGTYYYACSTAGHCDAGQRITIQVVNGSSSASSSSSEQQDPTGRQEEEEQDTNDTNGQQGACAAPVPSSTLPGYVTVSCRSRALSLSPGDNIYPDVPLASPYVDDVVVVKAVAAEIVDASGRPVPLSEVYLHHSFGDYRFIPGEGSEVRRSPWRNPLPEPYGLLVNGTQFSVNPQSRNTNLHVINTVGVSEDDLKACIECWCSNEESFSASIGCCRKCPSNSTDGRKDYFLQYNVTYKVADKETLDSTTPVDFVNIDIAGGVEYSVDAKGPDTEDVIQRTFAIDYFCPQTRSFSVLACRAHQHIGGKCVRMTDAKTGERICESCPEYGTSSANEPGNESGYVVGMTEYSRFDNPVRLEPGQEVTVTAVYDASQKYGGVMSILGIMFEGMELRDECNIDFGGFIQPELKEGRVSESELIQGLSERVRAMPLDCGNNLRQYLEDTLITCAPAAYDLKSMDVLDADDKKVCCDTINEKEDVMSYLLKQGIDIASRSECFCPLGELLRYGVATESLEAVIQLSSICTGSLPDDGVIDGLYVALQSIFSPRCPDIKAAMEQMLSQKAAETDTDAPVPSEPSVVQPSPESSLGVEEEQRVSASAGRVGTITMLAIAATILSV